MIHAQGDPLQNDYLNVLLEEQYPTGLPWEIAQSQTILNTLIAKRRITITSYRDYLDLLRLIADQLED